MISYKGRLSFIQYLPKKPHKWGMKAWVLAVSLNGYSCGWKLYTGKDGSSGGPGLAHRVVMNLADDHRLEGKGYLIYTDNFYSSPNFFQALTDKGFGPCGTARKDRRGIPLSIRNAGLQRGEIASSVDDGVLALKWRDKRDVMMLSTFHDTHMVAKTRRSRSAEGGVEVVQKPAVVEDYNQHMGGVDKGTCLLHVHANSKHVCHISLFCFTLADQLVIYYEFSHRSVKWWKRVFFHLLDVAIVNCHLLFKSVTGSKLSQLDFRVAVAKGLMEGLERQRPRRSAGTQALPLRLTERPFPEPVPDSKRPDRAVCSDRAAHKRHQTGYRCKICHTHLCLYTCFERYHTLKDYKVKY